MRYYILLILFFCSGLQWVFGYSFTNPNFDLGTFGTSALYRETVNTSGYTNETNYGGTGTDAIMKFTITMNMDVAIYTCGSEVPDTYLYILDASQNLLYSNDDNENGCDNKMLSYINTTLTPGTYYIVSEGLYENGPITTTISANATRRMGDAMDNPIGFGEHKYNFSYTDTENPLSFMDQCIYYQFTLSNEMKVTISNCGSQVDATFLCLYDGDGNYLYDNGGCYDCGQCSNPEQAYIQQTLPAGTYYVYTIWGGLNPGNITTSISGEQFSSGVGDTYNDPITAGSFYKDFTYTNTQNTNNFYNQDFQTSNDVYYKFTLEKKMDLTISHCGSEVSDTYLHLLNASGTEIISNDNSSADGSCSNTSHAFLKSTLSAGTYYVVSEGTGSSNGNITTTIQATITLEDPQPSIGLQSIIGLNYIYTTTPFVACADATTLNTSQSLQTIQYFDGLGRSIETVQRGITPAKYDLVTVSEYDDFGREKWKWLPCALSDNNGAFVSDYGSQAISTNGNDAKPYTTIEYEASPLNRISAQYAPGTEWYTNHKRKTTEYTTNATNTVKKFSVNSNQLSCDGYYDVATLYGQKTTDEDGRTVEEFADKLGRKVLSRVAGDHDTYYVYDDLGNLCYVLPPLAADALGSGTYDNSADALLKYAYLYTYDARKRCIGKRLPGCDWIYLVYDLADRLILSQDGNQRAKSQWTVNKYDQFGRLLYSGIVNNSDGRATMESNYAGTLFSETTGSSTVPGYTCNNVTPSTLLTVNYYDNYDFLTYTDNNPGGMLSSTAPDGYTAPDKDHVKTMLTGTRTYHWDDPSKFEVTALYYDKYGRTVQTRASNHLSGYDITYNEIDFTGKPNKTLKIDGISGNSATYTELYTYTYDHAQRLLTTTHSLNGGTAVTLVSNSYDPLGRLQTKTLGGVDATTYSYNVRSWISGISGNRFTENLYYNQNTANLATFTPSYNGNIAGLQWSVPAEGLGYNRAYSFAYDGLNRLTAGNYTGGTTGAYNESFGYDKMGNITTLNRNENGAGLNQLTLNYTGNQLLNVSDDLAVTKLYGSEAFDNKASLSSEYLYDTNGSMTYDANSGISTIQYNVLNLPTVVQFAEGHQNLYTYDAGGKKLRVNNYTLHTPVNVPQGNISTLPTNSGDYTQTVTDYVGNMIYENGSLKEILLPEGYWQSGVYYYYLKDHLGDNRVTINSSGAVIEKSHYYPSGMRFYPESSSNSAALPYRYNGKELETMNGLNQYDYGARRREAGLPIWTAVDPLAEKHYNTSPYAYCSDDPMNKIDPDGRDEKQRQEAIAKANEYVQKNPGDSYKMGAKGSPGHKVDCSGLASNCVKAGGEKDPNNGVKNGVKNIENNTKEVEIQNAQAGNLITFSNSEHIGVITNVVRDKEDNVIGVKFIDSGGTPGSGKSGPRNSTAIIGKDYWGKQVSGVFKWDTKPDTNQNNATTSNN